MDLNEMFLIFGMGYGELVIIFLVILVLFGGKKIPEIARGLGKGINEFKKAKNEVQDAIMEESQPRKVEDAKIVEKKTEENPEETK